MLKQSPSTQILQDYRSFFEIPKKASQKRKIYRSSNERKLAPLDSSNYIYAAVIGLPIGQINLNGDYVGELDILEKVSMKSAGTEGKEESVYRFESWINKPFARQHVMNDPEKDAYGKIVDSIYDSGEKNVYMLVAVDKNKDQALAKAIEMGLQNSVSAGWKVSFSKCSYCGEKFYNSHAYCSHVKYKKCALLPTKDSPNQAWQREIEEKYPGIIDKGFTKICEVCSGTEGVELSAVISAAYPSARVIEVLKLANLEDRPLVTEYLKSAGVEDTELDKVLETIQEPGYQKILDERFFNTSREARKFAEEKSTNSWTRQGFFSKGPIY